MEKIFKGLGWRQKEILYSMLMQENIITKIETTGEPDLIWLTDPDCDNVFDDVTPVILGSLFKRNLLDVSKEQPSLQTTVSTYTLNKGMAERMRKEVRFGK